MKGDTAHNDPAPSPDYPLNMGGTAETTAPSAVSDGDRVKAWFDEYGRLIVALKSTSGGEASLGQVGGYVTVVRLEKTRPADTTAYAANDAICDSAGAGTVWTFPVARSGGPGSGVVTGVQAQTDDSATTAQLELDLYDDSITAINDNAEATRLYANKSKFLRTVLLPALAKKTTNSDMAEAYADVAIPFDAVDGTNLIGILRTLTAFTPVSGAKYTVTIFCALD